MVPRRHGGPFIEMNRLTILQLSLAAALILQAFAWTPPATNGDDRQESPQTDQLVYRTKPEEAAKHLIRFSF